MNTESAGRLHGPAGNLDSPSLRSNGATDGPASQMPRAPRLDSVRVYVAPGEAPDVAEAIETSLNTIEVDHLSEVRPGEEPAILLLSRGLVGIGSGPDFNAIPEHVVVVAVDGGARRLAESADRLFLSLEDLTGTRALARALRAAAHHSLALLTVDQLSGGRGTSLSAHTS